MYFLPQIWCPSKTLTWERVTCTVLCLQQMSNKHALTKDGATCTVFYLFYLSVPHTLHCKYFYSLCFNKFPFLKFLHLGIRDFWQLMIPYLHQCNLHIILYLLSLTKTKSLFNAIELTRVNIKEKSSTLKIHFYNLAFWVLIATQTVSSYWQWVLRLLKGAVSWNSAKLENYKMPVKLRETWK